MLPPKVRVALCSALGCCYALIAAFLPPPYPEFGGGLLQRTLFGAAAAFTILRGIRRSNTTAMLSAISLLTACSMRVVFLLAGGFDLYGSAVWSGVGAWTAVAVLHLTMILLTPVRPGDPYPR